MAKQKKIKRKPRVRPITRSTGDEASTKALISSHSTSGPDATPQQKSVGGWTRHDSTTAPEIGKASEAVEAYARTPYELLDKYVFSRQLVTFFLALIVMGLVIVQDNNAGNLGDLRSILTTCLKCIVVLSLFVLTLIVQWLCKKVFR